MNDVVEVFVDIKPCRAGSFCIEGQEERCNVGSHSPAPASSSCIPCPMGSMAPLDGSSACEICPAGRFASSIGFSRCLNCSVGTFIASNGSSSCQPCDKGNYSDRPGATECQPCIPGTYAPSINTEKCLPCDGEATVVVNRTSCEIKTCGAGRGADRFTGECQLCEEGYFATHLSFRCTQCLAGNPLFPMYVLAVKCSHLSTMGRMITGSYSALKGMTACLQCDKGMTCREGLAYSEPGYWLWLNQSSHQVRSTTRASLRKSSLLVKRLLTVIRTIIAVCLSLSTGELSR
jgi:hypothetical protein